MSTVDRPHKDNVPGPFYVCDGCCTACGIPFFEAPGMFEYDNDSHCYVKKQPENEQELNQILRTVVSAELECIRYRGDNDDVLRRLAQSGVGHLSDIPVQDIPAVSRNHVTFDAAKPMDNLLLDQDLARDFQRYLWSQESEYVIHKFTPISSDGEKTSFSYSSYKDNLNLIEFHFLGSSGGRWLVVSETSFQVHDWLTSDDRFCNIQWYTKEEWETSKEWQSTPW